MPTDHFTADNGRAALSDFDLLCAQMDQPERLRSIDYVAQIYNFLTAATAAAPRPSPDEDYDERDLSASLPPLL